MYICTTDILTGPSGGRYSHIPLKFNFTNNVLVDFGIYKIVFVVVYVNLLDSSFLVTGMIQLIQDLLFRY